MRFNGRFGGIRRRHGASALRQRHPLRRPIVQVSSPARHLQPGTEEPNALLSGDRGEVASIRTIARPASKRRWTSPSRNH
jgi:hypothetical protein